MTILPFGAGVLDEPLCASGGDFRRGLLSIMRLLGDHLGQDLEQGLWTVRSFVRDRRKVLGLMPHQSLGQCPFRERRMPSQQEVQRAAQAVYVSTRIDGM